MTQQQLINYYIDKIAETKKDIHWLNEKIKIDCLDREKVLKEHELLRALNLKVEMFEDFLWDLENMISKAK